MQQESFQEMMNPDHDLFSEAGISRDLYERLNLAGDFGDDEVEAAAEVVEEEEEEEEEEFSFMFGGESTSIAADDAFINGEIRPVFPLFNRDLLFSGGDDGGDSESDSVSDDLPMRQPVKRVFVETNEPGQVTSTIPENDEIAGPYCEWSSSKKPAAEAESCKKSNSTGFSKIWRIKEFVGRSNSDGRDAFVFLNNSHAPPPKKAEEKSEKKETTAAAVKSSHPVKKSGKKAAPLSAHEVYLRSKAKDEVRRRSYLPYRPELVGFFTTVNGGLTKNVHPY